MRIFLVWQQATREHAVPAYRFWRPYLENGMSEAGHEIIETRDVEWPEGLALAGTPGHSEWLTLAWERTLDAVALAHRSKPVDMFFSYLFPQQTDVSAVARIKKMGIPCVNFFCDNLREYDGVPAEFRVFDLHWGPEPAAAARYRKAGHKYLFAAYPIWIPRELRTADHPERYGVTFIGSKDIQRETLLAAAIKRGATIEIRGSGWDARQSKDGANRGLGARFVNQAGLVKRAGIGALACKLTYLLNRPVERDVFEGRIKEAPDQNGYISVTQQSKAVIGINRYPSFRRPFWNPPTFIRLRDLEAPMMGACYLTEWTEGLGQLFDLGDEIEVYRNAGELCEKISLLERDGEKRRRMRRQAQKRALADHRMEKTIGRVASELGIWK